MTTTSHNGALYGVERGLLEQLAHYVDGTPLVGGRGTPLADLLADSYRREADELLSDLDSLAGCLGDGDQGILADRLRNLASVLDNPAAIHQDSAPPARESGIFTADFRNGGRPITGETDEVPDPPALDVDDDETETGSKA